MAKKDSLTAYEEKPSIRINEDELPELKNWEVDKEYTLEVKAKLTGLSRSEYEDNPKLWGTFRVTDVTSDDEANEDPGIKGFKSVPVTRRTKGS